MKKIGKNKKKGFTLIELIIVIAILAILALILVPSISGYIGQANKARDEANARSIYMAAVMAVQTEDDADELNAIEKMSNITSGFTVYVTGTGDDKEVAYVKYNDVTFDGEEFNPDPLPSGTALTK